MKKYLIEPGSKVDLDDFDPADTSGFQGGKKEAQAALLEQNAELEALQEMLYAQRKHKLLVVLQGMDTGGKDGVIRHVFEGVNPQGVRVAGFKAPTPVELDHDYLWRVHPQVPGRGEIVIFNRSHYEDVLVVRVHGLVPKKVWSRRYAHINAFEKTLAEEGTTILKFFLHISPQEQKERLLARLQDPTKHWKYNPGDLKERQLWKDYTRAYEDALARTSTAHAPWYVIPSDKKWYRNWVIANILIKTLKDLNVTYPAPDYDVQAALETFEADSAL
ncbi:MAG: polyphosphate kinase 2 family protein [Chloroflexota bacterium]